MTERTEIKKAIAVLEAQRAILGDAVVDAATAPLREQLITLERDGQQPGVSLPGEQKLITILFADVVGSTALAERLGAETTRLVLDRCLRRVSEAVDEFGGTVSSLMGDGLMAFFGVPQVHEDDAERAVLAAGRIHQLVAGYARELGQSLEVRVGINTGRVVLGEMGGDIHSEYTAMGSPVNLTARLQSAAIPGKTLLGDSTARMVRYRFHVEPVEPLQLKGFEEPVAAFDLIAERAQPSPARGIPGLQSVLVGRDDELAKLVNRVSDLEQGIGGIATLIGEPGIGKSRLLQETKVAAYQEYQPHFAEGRAYSYTQDQPFSVILDLLAELLDLAADDSPAIVDLKLESALSPLFAGELETVWPFLASLLGAPVPPQYAPALSGLDPEALKARLIQAVQMFLRRMAGQRPLILSFEDLHWADGGSLSLIESLLSDTEHYPMFLLLLFRPDRDKPVWQLKLTAETHFAHRYLELPLSPLDAQASTEMIENLLEVANFPAELRDMIGQKAQGNPLYVEELIRGLIDSGALVREGDTWMLRTQVTELAVPETLEKVIQARFDRLPAAERATLQAASVIGRRFAYRVLAGLVPDEASLRNHLLRLQQVGMIRERSRLPEPEYIFKHVIVQEVTYSTLLVEQRRELHQRVAETLEKLYPDRREELAGTLAQHYAAAGQNDKAIKLFVQAARRAQELYAYEEALHYLRNTLALRRQEDSAAEELILLLEYLADILRLVEEALEAFHLYQEALDLQQGLVEVDFWSTVRLQRKICDAWSDVHNDDKKAVEAQAQSYLKAGLRLTDGQEPHLETVRLLVVASYFVRHWQETDPDLKDAEFYAQAAVEMAEQLDAPVELSAALNALGTNYNQLGRVRDYLRVGQRRQQLSRDPRFDDLRERLDILTEHAVALKIVGQYAQAIPLLLEAEVLAEQIQEIGQLTLILAIQAEAWMRLDRWAEVLLIEEKIKPLQQRYSIRRVPGICWLLGFSASVHALRGEEESAARLARESYALMLENAGGEEKRYTQAQFY